MLTPQFELEQYDNYLLITIKAPYIKTNDVEIFIESNEFKFYVKPYFLRLYFPCEVIEDGRENAEYDISTGVFKIQIPKKVPGEFFPNLDMLTTLLETKKKHLMKSIEVVGTSNKVEDGSLKKNDDGFDGGIVNEEADDFIVSDEDDDLCWEVEQELFNPPDILTGYKYGFANKVNGVFSRLQGELYEVIDVPDPDKTSPEDRTDLRVKEESVKFDALHYIADFMEDDYIQELINWKAPWDIEYERILDAYKKSYPETSGLIKHQGNHKFFAEEEKFIFKEDEKKILLQLPNKDFLLDKNEEQTAFFSMVDIIFGYVYDHRTTEGESTSESPWTISKISSTLSWMDSFKNIQDVLLCNARRCLCYPLYRHWLLVQKMLDDVKRIFLLGRRWVLRYLLQIHTILQSDENKYILNDLYVTDLCVWIQKVKQKNILSIANKLQYLELKKEDMDFDLADLERTVTYIDDDESSEDGENSDSSEDGSSGSSEVSTSLDSDDDEDNVIVDSQNSPIASTTSRSDILETKGLCVTDEVEVVRTGLEELMTVQTKFVAEIDEDE